MKKKQAMEAIKNGATLVTVQTVGKFQGFIQMQDGERIALTKVTVKALLQSGDFRMGVVINTDAGMETRWTLV